MKHHHRPSKGPRGEDLPPCECGIPNAPQTRERHPESDPAESMRKELTQCQYCWKSKASGVVLKKCSGCGVDIYCGVECQKKAWPTHKTKCKLNRNIQANPTMATSLENLRAFTSKHRPTLAEYGIRALDLVVDHTRCLRDVLHLVLVHRAEAARIEMSFFLVTVDVVPLESFGGKAEEMREQLQLANEAQRGAGLTGSFGVVLTCMSPSNPAMNITFVGFTKRDLADFTPGMPWKEELTRRLNEGIVV